MLQSLILRFPASSLAWWRALTDQGSGCLGFLNYGINWVVAQFQEDLDDASVWPRGRRSDSHSESVTPSQDAALGTLAEHEFSGGDPPTETPRQSPTRDWGSIFQDLQGWARDIFFAALAAVLIVIFVVQPVKVEGTSMQPNLADQERIFVSKFIYHFSDIDRGDVIVFWYPNDVSKSFIKRVIGLPGDKLEIRKGEVYINGKRLGEPYLGPEYRDDSFHRIIEVPLHQYFVLGDHRSSSNDSRSWGFVPEAQIFGKAVFRYWPLSKLGTID